jgi:hypothetical protein
MTQTRMRHDDTKLDQVAASEFPENPPAVRLIAEFLRHSQSYDREFVEALFTRSLSATAGESNVQAAQAWEIRCLAALMLQQQFLHLSARDANESLAFLGLLGLLGPESSEPRVAEAVLTEGYTTTKPVAFLRQFRRRLRRLGRILTPMGRSRVTSRALQDFVAVARGENCKLSLARYLFQPDEVAERILAQVRRSIGEPTAFTYTYADQECHRRLSHLPEFEGSLLRILGRDSDTFWVGAQTSSRLNALVEQPINTVVLTVKPPGSDIEIEIKRAGHRAERPLTIVHDRDDGTPVPPSHRLFGGSSADMLQWEAGSSGCFAKIYWLVYRSPPPIAIFTAITHPNALPVGVGRTEHLIDYFSEPGVFGDEFAAMRQAMSQSIASFARERGQGLKDLEGPWGPTLQFFEYASPGQAILVGSTSYRLATLVRYLAPDGANHYFGTDHESRVPAHEARVFADSLLEEILGLYKPPTAPYRSHEQYIAAAFALPENRARADRVHASLSQQLGAFWATALAIRAHSYGESFVARNVGLKTVWERGRYTVRLIFMDHDNLVIPTQEGVFYDPTKVLPGTIIDEIYVIGHYAKSDASDGDVEHLRLIYRIDDATAERHRLLLNESMARAYKKTRHMLLKSAGLKDVFPKEFVESSEAWDRAVAIFLSHRERSDPSVWQVEAEALLERRGIPADNRASYLSGIEEFAAFLKRYAFLYTGEIHPAEPNERAEASSAGSLASGARDAAT